MSALTVESVTKALLHRGLLTKDQRLEATIKERMQRQRLLTEARERARKSGSPDPGPRDITAIDIVAAFGFPRKGSAARARLDEAEISKCLAETAELPFLRIDPLKLDPKLVTGVVSRPYARKHVLMPIAVEDGILTVAIANPFDEETVRNLRNVTGFEIRPVVATKSEILRTITDFFGFRTSVQQAANDLDPGIDLGNLEQLVQLKDVEELEATDQPVINAVEYILHYAYSQRASDLHIEPKREQSVIRIRIDGVLHTVHTMPKVVHNALVSRLKMLGRLDIAERRFAPGRSVQDECGRRGGRAAGLHPPRGLRREDRHPDLRSQEVAVRDRGAGLPGA